MLGVDFVSSRLSDDVRPRPHKGDIGKILRKEGERKVGRWDTGPRSSRSVVGDGFDWRREPVLSLVS